MKDVTFGVKVPESLRDEINEIMKASGLVGREFMQELVDAYGLDKTKQEIPEMGEEIRELQQLTHRVNEMYVYLGTRFQNIIALKEKEKEDIVLEAAEKKQAYEDKADKYKGEGKKIKEDMIRLEEALSSARKDAKDTSKALEELKGYNENYKELNDQYKITIEKLTKKVSQLQHLEEENEKLLKETANLKENNDTLASELWFAKREVEALNETMVKNSEEYQRSITQLKNQHQLEMQTSLLELQLENQKKVELLNQKTADMQKEYNDKLKELLFNVDKDISKKDKGEKDEH